MSLWTQELRARVVRNLVMYYILIAEDGSVEKSGFIKYEPGVVDGTFSVVKNMKDAERFSHSEAIHLQTGATVIEHAPREFYVAMHYCVDSSSTSQLVQTP